MDARESSAAQPRGDIIPGVPPPPPHPDIREPRPGQIAASTCCTDGCEQPGTHHRSFYVRGVDPSVYGEIETEAAFCCEHVDMLDSDVTPLVDLRVSATVRS